MSRIQGQFANKATAEKARQTLINAGVPAGHIHIWNNIPDSAPFSANRDSAAGGALLGGLVGGAVGAAVGAALGDSYDQGGTTPLAQSSSARLVIDSSETFDAIDIARVLQASGATDIHQSS